jgi:hypothetical protein
MSLIITSIGMILEGHEIHMDEIKNAYRILVGISQKKIPLGRPRSKWEDNIKIDLSGISCEVVYWIRSNAEL